MRFGACKYVLAHLLALGHAIHMTNGRSEQKQHTNLDILTTDYLVMENHLWSTINNGQNRENTLEHVYSVHQMNFEQNFGDVGIFWEYHLDEHRDVFVGIVSVNQTSSVCLTFLKSHNRRDVIELLNAVSHVRKSGDSIYERASRMDFWEFIQQDTRACTKGRRTVEAEQQVLYDYYKDITAALTKVYVITQFSYMIRTLVGNENCKQNSSEYRELFKERYVSLQNMIKPLMRTADRFAWTCDPDGNGADAYVNAIELTGFLQGYVAHETNINADASCTASCSDYVNTRSYRCNADTLCALDSLDSDKQQCNGRLRNCQPLEGDVSICPVTQPRDTRRYQYIESGNSIILGKNDTSCSDGLQTMKSWKKWFFKCSNCLCYCDDKEHSHRHFSLREVVSNVAENRIVTGVGLIKVNGIVQFLIVEKELIKYGQLNETIINDIPWQLGKQFRIDDRSVQSGIDYYALTWENRRINLDTVIAPLGNVVTGVRFALIDGVLSIGIRANRFDFLTGKVDADGVWMLSDVAERSVLHLNGLDVPSSTPRKSVRNTAPNLVAEFTPTDVTKDAAQHTVPFLDNSVSEPKHSVPLSGLGLYYKSQPGFGGFVAPQVVIYDFEPYISPPDEF